MLRLIMTQVLGAYLTKQAASGRYSRVASTLLGLAAARLGGLSRGMGMIGVLSALLGRRR